jgi:hypothetical protein
VIAAILIHARPGEDTGLVQGQPQFVIELSRGTLEVKKEDRWKRYQCEGLGVILTRKHGSLVGVRSEETLAPHQVRCNFSGLRALGPYQQPASYKHATIRPSPLLNSTYDTTPPAFTPTKVAERDLSSSFSPSCRSITPVWNFTSCEA